VLKFLVMVLIPLGAVIGGLLVVVAGCYISCTERDGPRIVSRSERRFHHRPQLCRLGLSDYTGQDAECATDAAGLDDGD
jgi:hypothetical protein